MKVSDFIGLVGLVTSAAMIGSVIVKDFNKEEKLGYGFERPSNVTEIAERNPKAYLTYENGETDEEKVIINADLDKKTNTIYFGNYTESFDRQSWPKDMMKIPPYAKHTRINPFSKTFLLHPKEVSVSGIEQKVYLVPQYAWDQDTRPFEEHKEAQQLIEGGEKIVDWATGKIPIPFFKDFFNSWKKQTDIREKEKIDELVKTIKKGYTATIIPSHIKGKLFGSMETAREYKISMDTSKLKEGVPVYLVSKLIFGDSTKAPHGSFPNKYGELETIIIEFSLESKEKETGVAKKISKKEKIVEGGKIIFSFRGEIYSINPDGSEKENLTKTEEYREESPQWSPDGEKIGFMRGSQIGVMKFEPNSKSIYLNFENTIQDPKFSWSPDSKKIFLYSNRESNPLIWDLTSNNLKKFRPWERGGGLYAKKLIWDPKEGLIVMSKSLDGGALVLISESGVGNGIGYKIIKDSNRIKEILDRQSDPQISPSGKKKVFSGKKFKEREIIYLSDIDGKNKKELAHGYSPRWQPISR